VEKQFSGFPPSWLTLFHVFYVSTRWGLLLHLLSPAHQAINFILLGFRSELVSIWNWACVTFSSLYLQVSLCSGDSNVWWAPAAMRRCLPGLSWQNVQTTLVAAPALRSGYACDVCCFLLFRWYQASKPHLSPRFVILSGTIHQTRQTSASVTDQTHLSPFMIQYQNGVLKNLTLKYLLPKGQPPRSILLPETACFNQDH
jgi:hypothetical protein